MNDTVTETEPTTEAAPETPSRGKAHRLPRQGSVHATMFENHGSNGPFFTVDLQHSYKDGDTWKYNRSFKVTDMDDVMKQAAAVQEKVKELALGRTR